jgi:hypothetical protein
VLRSIFGQARNTLSSSRVDCDIEDGASRRKQTLHAVRHSCHNMVVRRRVIEVWQETLGVGGEVDTCDFEVGRESILVGTRDQRGVEQGRARSDSAPPHLVSQAFSGICAHQDGVIKIKTLDTLGASSFHVATADIANVPLSERSNKLASLELDPKILAAEISRSQTGSTACPTPGASISRTTSVQSTLLGSRPPSSGSNSDHSFSGSPVDIHGHACVANVCILQEDVEMEDANVLSRQHDVHVCSPGSNANTADADPSSRPHFASPPPVAESDVGEKMNRPKEMIAPSPPQHERQNHYIRSPLRAQSTTNAAHSEIEEALSVQSNGDLTVSVSPPLEHSPAGTEKSPMPAKPSIAQLTVLPDGWCDCQTLAKWHPDSPRTPGGWPQRLPPLAPPTKQTNVSCEEKGNFWCPQATFHQTATFLVCVPSVKSASHHSARRRAFHKNVKRCA